MFNEALEMWTIMLKAQNKWGFSKDYAILRRRLEHSKTSDLHGILCIPTITTWETYTIMTGIKNPPNPIKNFRRHINPIPQQIDWELGLREATYQALLREQFSDAHLHEHLLEAPLHDRQDKAIPFGDIIVLARGQLYLTATGYKFIQDPYQNDCDDCHNERNHCNPLQCDQWKSHNINERLLALWTVKRIRHRDPNFGYIFELEYTISPIGTVISEGFVTRNGRFDYSVPGHIFVIKTNPRLNQAYHLNNNNHQESNEWHRNQANPVNYKLSHNSNQDYTKPNIGQFKPGIIIGIDSNGNQQILQSYPAFFTAFHPQIHDEQQLPDQLSTNDPKEFELYQKLIDSLASKTVPPNNKKQHRFSINKDNKKDKLTSITPTKITYNTKTTFKPTQETSSNEFLTNNNRLIPTTIGHVLIPTTTTTNTANNEQLHIITPIYVPTTITNQDTTKLLIQTTPLTNADTKSTQFPAYYPQTPLTTPTSPQTTRPTIPQTSITLHYFTPAEKIEKNHLPGITIQTQTNQLTKTTPIKSVTTIKPQQSKMPNNYKPLSTFSHPIKTIKQTTTASKEEDEDFDLFFEKISTEPMKASTPILNIETLKPKMTKHTTVRTTMKYKKPINLVDIKESEEDIEDNNENLFSVQQIDQTSETVPTTTQNLDKSEVFTLIINNLSTEAIKPITEDSLNESYSINEQLQSPDSETDTTIPYISSTVTQKIPNIINDSSTSTINEFTTIPLIETTTENIINKFNTTDERLNIMHSSLTIPQSTAYNMKEYITEPTTTIGTTKMYYTNTEHMNTEILSTTPYMKELIKEITLPQETVFTTNKQINHEENEEINHEEDTESEMTTESIFKTTFNHLNENNKETEVDSTTITQMRKIKDNTIEYLNEEMTTKYNTITEPTMHTTEETTIKSETTSPLIEYSSTTSTKLKQSTTTKVISLNEFLIDKENTKKKKNKSKNNINEDDDIFGNMKEEIRSTTKETPKIIKESEFADELFGNNRRSKMLNLLRTTTTNAPVKIIFSNFYAASTESPTALSDKNFTKSDFVMEKATVYEVTTNANDNLPFTDQSYSTSISFQVNKNYNNNTNITNNLKDVFHLESSIKAKLDEVIMNNNTNYKVYKAEMPIFMNKQNESIAKDESKKLFDNLALQLVNHARSIDYLNKKPKTKYKRRSYKPKNKKVQQRN